MRVDASGRHDDAQRAGDVPVLEDGRDVHELSVDRDDVRARLDPKRVDEERVHRRRRRHRVTPRAAAASPSARRARAGAPPNDHHVESRRPPATRAPSVGSLSSRSSTPMNTSGVR